MRRARAAAPAPPPPPQKAPHPGCGSCRGMESSGPPPIHPGPSHTPWKSWAPALHPQDSHSYAQPRRRGQLKEQRR